MKGAQGNGEKFDMTLCMNGVERDLINKLVTPSLDLNSDAQRGEINGDEVELDSTLSLNGKFGVDPARRSVRVSSSISNLAFKVDAMAENRGDAHQESSGSIGAGSSRNGNNPSGVQSVSLEIENQPSGLIENGLYENFSILEMPLVSTRWPGVDGENVKGFLYKYEKANEVCIVCMCHGRFFSPVEFVRHGGGDVEEPLKNILVICKEALSSTLFRKFDREGQYEVLNLVSDGKE